MGSSSIQLNVLTFPIISHSHHTALWPKASVFGSVGHSLLNYKASNVGFLWPPHGAIHALSVWDTYILLGRQHMVCLVLTQ